MQLPVMRAVFVDELRDLHVVAAIFRDLREFAFFEPFDRLQTFRRFFHAEGRGRDGIQRQAMIQRVLQFHEHVQRRQLREVERRVAVQHFVVKPQIVEADDHVGALQFPEQIVDLRFAENFIFARQTAARHADAHLHLRNIAPAADFIRRLLRFQIEINNVFQCRQIYDLRYTIYESKFGLKRQIFLRVAKSGGASIVNRKSGIVN
jgi:hypothetical protein